MISILAYFSSSIVDRAVGWSALDLISPDLLKLAHFYFIRELNKRLARSDA
jgi:hypothetical protein